MNLQHEPDRRSHDAEAPPGTKESLLLAAGELFAEHGFDGTSVRSIVEKAGVNIAAINYHFGTKENLYLSVLHYVTEYNREVGAPTFLPELERVSRPEELSELITRLALLQMRSFFSPKVPLWHGRLIMRSLLEPRVELRSLVERNFRPGLDALRAIFRKANPKLTDEETRLMAYSWNAQVVFYVFARWAILLDMEEGSYAPAFIEAAARQIARGMIATLGLPEWNEERADVGVAEGPGFDGGLGEGRGL